MTESSKEDVKISFNRGALRISFHLNRITPDEETVFLRITKHAPLYLGLKFIHTQDPEALPKLIQELVRFREFQQLAPDRAFLVWKTINGLEEITDAN